MGLLVALLAGGCLRVARDGETPFRLVLMDFACGNWGRAMKPIEPSGACDALLRGRVVDPVMIIEFNAVPTRPMGLERLAEARAEVLEVVDGFICGYRRGLEGGAEAEELEGRGVLWRRAYREGERFGALERDAGLEGSGARGGKPGAGDGTRDPIEEGSAGEL